MAGRERPPRIPSAAQIGLLLPWRASAPIHRKSQCTAAVQYWTVRGTVLYYRLDLVLQYRTFVIGVRLRWMSVRAAKD